MNHQEIDRFIQKLAKTKERNIIIIDFANVDRWQDSTKWPVGLKQLGKLISHISYGKKFLRRFYYGEDYGQKDSSKELLPWSETMLTNARYSGFEIVITRRGYHPSGELDRHPSPHLHPPTIHNKVVGMS